MQHNIFDLIAALKNTNDKQKRNEILNSIFQDPILDPQNAPSKD